jgi:shikimate kinase
MIDRGIKPNIKVALTGFMGVGKSSVARHLSQILRAQRVDLDHFIEAHDGRKIAEIIDQDGLERYRAIESHHLARFLRDSQAGILSLGGGTFTIEANRHLLKRHGFTTLWLESTFEHCWLNISFSRKDRPLARDKETARKLFEERQEFYCLADWHYIVRPGFTSFDVARSIADEIFS